ncbi:uncharacterized protein G2W53_014279 [Senna tora]|uniref:Uncharacterized protein n=1 Tax=Senna tora TaxID=362788 RepID=A0A835C654_9FABA|nr:uncharacterized protein G2W53_014279 [Senna tora]
MGEWAMAALMRIGSALNRIELRGKKNSQSSRVAPASTAKCLRHHRYRVSRHHTRE